MPTLLARSRTYVSGVDDRLDKALDRVRSPVADRVFFAASELGDFSLLWLLLAAARGLRRSERDERAALRVGLGAMVESALVNGLIKSLFRRKRPPWETIRAYPIRQPRTSSFPSGHATSAFSSAILLAEDDPLWPVYYALAVIVATSRVYVKIHHPSDVLVGVGVGVSLGLLGRRLMPLPKEVEGGAPEASPA